MSFNNNAKRDIALILFILFMSTAIPTRDFRRVGYMNYMNAQYEDEQIFKTGR